MEILPTVKLLLKLDADDDTQDALLTVLIDMAVQQILNYCNIKELPEELKYIAAQMAAESYAEILDDPKVSSVSEAGRTVEFAPALDLARLAVVSKLNDRKIQLARFRQQYR
jgi:Phage QLRG family, putative DNA packaging.